VRYVIRVTVDEVAAAHHLPGYPGECARPHGHNWTFVATIGADRLDGDMVVDFAEVKSVFRALEHTTLNDDLEVVADGHRPTTERLAEVLAARLQRLLDRKPNRPRLLALTVRETGRNEVTFTP
jgi:6-pyruvoyltetrahydropterin/6-carboxytetrahydropterin synthase